MHGSHAFFLPLLFQSTHPMRGATSIAVFAFISVCISIHAPHAGCDVSFDGCCVLFSIISIHAPHAGCDEKLKGLSPEDLVISIHAPHAGCDRRHVGDITKTYIISIHAPHAGCDPRLRLSRAASPHFNPRTPCGVRQDPTYNLAFSGLFQSTHPMRGATSFFLVGVFALAFQSTHPMRGATQTAAN